MALSDTPLVHIPVASVTSHDIVRKNESQWYLPFLRVVPAIAALALLCVFGAILWEQTFAPQPNTRQSEPELAKIFKYSGPTSINFGKLSKITVKSGELELDVKNSDKPTAIAHVKTFKGEFTFHESVNFELHQPLAIFYVVGTKFEVDVDASKSEIRLLEGVVRVADRNSGESFILTAPAVKKITQKNPQERGYAKRRSERFFLRNGEIVEGYFLKADKEIVVVEEITLKGRREQRQFSKSDILKRQFRDEIP